MVLKTLTIGGSDTWGGGGIQTDLKTFENLQTFGLSVLTCLAVEQEQDFVIRPLAAELVAEQLQTIEGAFQLNGVKIGLLSSLENIALVQAFCQRNRGKFPIILDPVLAFKESDQHLQDDYLSAIKALIAAADLVTPNLQEMKLLTGHTIQTVAEMATACQQLFTETGTPVLLKGGANIDATTALDYYWDGEMSQLFTGPVSQKTTVHGAGCCLSAALCAYQAHGFPMLDSIARSKRFVYQAIEHGVPLGKAGNVWHPDTERSLNL